MGTVRESNAEVPIIEEKDNTVLENQGNIFENLIERVIPGQKAAAQQMQEAGKKPQEQRQDAPAEHMTGATGTGAKTGEDTLLTQIDEFRERAQQLQQMLDRKQEKAMELQQLVAERADKAEELERLVKERQDRADGFTVAVEKKIDSMVSNVDTRLNEVKTAVNTGLQDNQAKDEVRTAQLKDALEQVNEKVDRVSAATEQLDTVKADLSEKIHTESVQSYRNLSELLKNVEGRLNKLDALEAEVSKLRGMTCAILVFSVINLVGMIVSILTNLGFIGF